MGWAARHRGGGGREPTWNIHFDMDEEQAAFTREMLLGWLEADK